MVNNDTIKQLSKRLKSLNSEINEEKTQNPDLSAQRIEKFHSKLDYNKNLFENKLNIALDSADRITNSIKSEKFARELLTEQLIKKRELCKNYIQNDLNALNNNTNEFEKKISRVIEESCSAIKMKINKEARTRKLNSELYLQRFKQSIGSLESVLENETQSRKISSEDLSNRIQ